jgi:hypothetical protein
MELTGESVLIRTEEFAEYVATGPPKLSRVADLRTAEPVMCLVTTMGINFPYRQTVSKATKIKTGEQRDSQVN